MYGQPTPTQVRLIHDLCQTSTTSAVQQTLLAKAIAAGNLNTWNAYFTGVLSNEAIKNIRRVVTKPWTRAEVDTVLTRVMLRLRQQDVENNWRGIENPPDPNDWKQFLGFVQHYQNHLTFSLTLYSRLTLNFFVGRSHKTILFFDQTEKLIKPVSVASTSTSGENLQQIRSTSVSAHIPDVPPVQVVSIQSVVTLLL